MTVSRDACILFLSLPSAFPGCLLGVCSDVFGTGTQKPLTVTLCMFCFMLFVFMLLPVLVLNLSQSFRLKQFTLVSVCVVPELIFLNNFVSS